MCKYCLLYYKYICRDCGYIHNEFNTEGSAFKQKAIFSWFVYMDNNTYSFKDEILYIEHQLELYDKL